MKEILKFKGEINLILAMTLTLILGVNELYLLCIPSFFLTRICFLEWNDSVKKRIETEAKNNNSELS